MKIKLFLAAVMAAMLLSCEGPMGPQGPQGPAGELNWKVYDFNIPSSAWELVGDVNGLNSYYVYVFEGNQAPQELAQVLEYDGDVTGYFVSQLDNGDEVLSPLPYIVYNGSSNSSGEWLWSEQYTFDFTRNSIAFYALYNDFATSTTPPNCKFRISLKW